MSINKLPYLATNTPRTGVLTGVRHQDSQANPERPDLRLDGSWEPNPAASFPGGAGSFYIGAHQAWVLCKAGIIRYDGPDAKGKPRFSIAVPNQRICLIKAELPGNKKELRAFAVDAAGQAVQLEAQPEPPQGGTPAPAPAPPQAPSAPQGAPVAPPAPGAAAPAAGAPVAPAAPAQATAAGPGMPAAAGPGSPAGPAPSGNGRRKVDKIETLAQIARGSETYLMAMRTAKRAVLDFMGMSAEDFSGLSFAEKATLAGVARAAADTNVIRWEKLGAVAFVGIEDAIAAIKVDDPEHGALYRQLKRALTGELVAPALPRAAAPARTPGLGADGGPVEDEDDDLPF